MKKSFWKKVLSMLVCLTLVVSYVPTLYMGAAAAESTLNILSGSKKSDPSTIDWEEYFGPDRMDTEFAGGVWTDKSVFTEESDELPGVALDDKNNFLVSLSSIASNLAVTGHTSAPTDTMLVLDVSGSMVNKLYQVGTVRSWNYYTWNYYTANAIDMSVITAMVDATNATIEKLMDQNTNNRVGVVLYSGNISSDSAATPDTATVLLPLNRYDGVNGEYLSVDTTWTTSTLYEWSMGWSGGSYVQSGEATYVAEGTDVKVSVKDGLETESGNSVKDSSKTVVGGTYIQNGLYKAMEEFLGVDDTVVPVGRPQAGAERMPVMVLMTDGAPTIATTQYTDIGNSDVGDGLQTNDCITFLTQLTAAYVRGKVAEHYQENADDEKDMLFLTLGLGTENSTEATNTLYPAGSTQALKEYWNTYLSRAAGRDITYDDIAGIKVTVRRDAAVAEMNYVDKYFYATDAQGMINSFGQIISEIELKAENYATLVEGGSADFSGYVTFEDELGEMMYVSDMKGVLMSDGEGGVVLYTGKGMAESMTNGVMGTITSPTERGDELVRTVRERITGINTTQAQQLIGYAYNDGQLYYTDDNNWSNYIGWYADANGEYAGFWDKDSGFDNAPEGAVYANRSYGYLGVNGESDMMHVVVMVRTEIATLHQTVLFKIPASLLPTVQYKVTLQEDDPNVVEEFVREDAIPMQLVFEVGLRPDINSINLEEKIAEHIAKGGHVHRNDDGTVTFYSNEWKIGNDINQNGIPDPEEVDTAVVARSHFHPAKDNSRYYYIEDTPVLDAQGNRVAGKTRPIGTYYHDRYIYNRNVRTTVSMPIAANTLATKAQYDSEGGYWYIPAGTMYEEVSRFITDKTQNVTDTLYYSDYPAVFENSGKQDVYAFLGNNGSFTVAPAQGIALTKTVARPSVDKDAPTAFTFNITLSEAVPAPVITDTDGNLLAGIATVSGKTVTVTLSAGQTVVISGIPAGTEYTVEEEVTKYYSASSVNASGTVEANTVHDVEFVNTSKNYGTLYVSKDVNYPTGFVPGNAHNNKIFGVTVSFTGDITGIEAPADAVQNGNNFTLTLKDGQSATFANIPEGVTYTVTESTVPNGYALQEIRYSDDEKTVHGNDADEVHVVNQYTLAPVYPKVVLCGDKTLLTNEGGWQGETFTVELLRIDNFADEEPVSTGLTATMTEAAPYYEIDLSSIEFTAAGTYYFRAVEVIPEDRNENIAYDRTFGLFSITVGDDDADGALEIMGVEAYQNTTVTEDPAGGWTVEKDFTNVVTTDRIYLDIQKHVVDTATQESVATHLGDITFGLFDEMSYDDGLLPKYYVLTDTKGKATIMVPVTKELIEEQGTDGQLIYFLREIAPSVRNRVIGMEYDESWLYAISVTWDDLANKAVVEYAPIVNGVVGDYEELVNDSFIFEHTNSFDSTISVDIDLSGEKTLNGESALGGRQFTFGLYESTAAFVRGQTLDTVSNNGNYIAFNNVTFKAPGVYYLVAKEEASDLGGITVDATEYHITVEVEKFTDSDGITRLRVVDGYPTVVKYGSSEEVGVDGLDFNNIYTVTGDGAVTISGKKTLNGRQLVAGEFEIGLYSDAQCKNAIETVANKADGTFTFSTRTYTAADLGDDLSDKIYTYYVKEIDGGKGGVTYDDDIHTVTVTVSHKDGELIVTPSGNAVSLQITNNYNAKPVDVTLKGNKKLSGDWSSVTNKNFTFQLFRADVEFNITDLVPVDTVTVSGQADFSMTLHYEDGEEGFYYYVLKEDTSARAGGVGYDAGEYHVTVNVSDPGDGQLSALQTMYRPGGGDVSVASFTNSYSVEPVSVTLTGDKSYVNANTGASKEMSEGMFAFAVLEGDDPEALQSVATGYNLADGTIKFTPINYYEAGVYNYTVVEVPGEEGGVVYDTDAKFAVTVTVTDNGDGTLDCNVDYHDTPVAFENQYVQQSAQVTLNGVKNFDGDWSYVHNKNFEFELYETDADFKIGDAPIASTFNGVDGSFRFNTITYAGEGTHYYVITEANGAADNGITYSEVKYHITVKVEDDGDGNLIPTVTATDSSVEIAADEQNERFVTVSGLVFTNGYHAKPAIYTPKAEKEYKGDEMKTFDFVLTVDGEKKQVKQNGADGKVLFDSLTFDKVGEYELTIREQENILWGFIRWDRNVYTITLFVEDDGNGQLFVNEEKTMIVSEKGRDDLIFRNVHKDVITKKDVFDVNEPAVSIDGENVDKGDVLIYTISYTNYDSVPVDIIITDEIPAYTTYVEDSADNGGVYADGELAWNIEVNAGESVTVSFKVKVNEANVTVVNKATVLEGENRIETNTVSNIVEAPEEKDPPVETPTEKDPPVETPTEKKPPVEEKTSPVTGVNTMLWLWISLLCVSGFGVVSTAVIGKKRNSAE